MKRQEGGEKMETGKKKGIEIQEAEETEAGKLCLFWL